MVVAAVVENPRAYRSKQRDLEAYWHRQPLDPSRCVVSGTALSDPSRGAVQRFYVHTSGRPVGGADFVVNVQLQYEAFARPISATVDDHGNGSYAVTYVVPAGAVEWTVEVVLLRKRYFDIFAAGV